MGSMAIAFFSLLVCPSVDPSVFKDFKRPLKIFSEILHEVEIQ